MKLFHSTVSPNSRRVRMFIAEKKISISLQTVNLAEKEQFSDWFKAVNPRQQVPALLLDDGTTVTEVLAIWRFLEETYPEPNLLGGDATGKALVTMWERRVELDGFAPTMEGVRNALAGLKGRALSGPHDYGQFPSSSSAVSNELRTSTQTSMHASRKCSSWPELTSRQPISPPL